jgi:hypothetical protein
MSAEQNVERHGRRSRRSKRTIGSLLLLALVLVGVVAQAGARTVEPTLGPWKGKTTQKTAVFFAVREDGTVGNVRLTYRDAICGKAVIHEANAKLVIDESGHFSGIVYPANGGVELEGTFTGPTTVKGKIIAGEASGLPGCAGGTFKFSAGPKY